MPTTIYQQSQVISSAIISLDYSPKKFLSFNVPEASQGQILWSGNEATKLQCQIRGATYTFDYKHLQILSQSERNALYSRLGVDGSQLEAGLVENPII